MMLNILTKSSLVRNRNTNVYELHLLSEKLSLLLHDNFFLKHEKQFTEYRHYYFHQHTSYHFEYF